MQKKRRKILYIHILFILNNSHAQIFAKQLIKVLVCLTNMSIANLPYLVDHVNTNFNREIMDISIWWPEYVIL